MITRVKDRMEPVFCEFSLSENESNKIDIAVILGPQHAVGRPLVSKRRVTSAKCVQQSRERKVKKTKK
jgi:hypothetical protein